MTCAYVTDGTGEGVKKNKCSVRNLVTRSDFHAFSKVESYLNEILEFYRILMMRFTRYGEADSYYYR
jgi:hypothetical protein